MPAKATTTAANHQHIDGEFRVLRPYSAIGRSGSRFLTCLLDNAGSNCAPMPGNPAAEGSTPRVMATASG